LVGVNPDALESGNNKRLNMNKYVQICSVVLLFVLIASCKGQNKTDLPKDSISQPESSLSDVDPYFIESNTITTPYGPGSITRNILQDRKGNIWLASWEGIIRYDGKSFTNFTNKEGLRRFHTFSVLEDRKGNIWFGTIGAGVYRYDGKLFTNFTTKDGLANDYVGCIYEDETGNIWFGTEGGASSYDGESFHNFTTKDGLTNNDVHSIIEDKTGKIWFGTRGDACFYDGETFTNFANKEGLSFINVWSIIEDRKGNIWLGGNDGLWRYDGNSFTNYTTDFVGYIYEGKRGNIWISAGKGLQPGTMTLYRYTNNTLSGPLRSTNIEQIIKIDGLIFGIFEDMEGCIWFGTLNGVCRYDGNTFNYFKDEEVKE
jgi:ligand-binding sensor domain-containing protein